MGFHLCQHQVLISAGSLPPLAASFAMICLCNHTFMVAESLVLPVYFNSAASCFRAAMLLSRSRAFIRSTMDVRQASFSPLAAADRRFLQHRLFEQQHLALPWVRRSLAPNRGRKSHP